MGQYLREALVLVILGTVERARLPELTGRVGALCAASGGGVLACYVMSVRPDLVTVEALAQLQLVARRHGCRVVLRDASAELRDLVNLSGLADVLPDGG